MSKTIMLELGCGNNPRKDTNYQNYIGIDCIKTDCTTYVVKLGWEPIPLPDNSVDFVLGDQFLEHIPRYAMRIVSDYPPEDARPEEYTVDVIARSIKIEEFNPLIELLNEVWRVSKQGALVQFHTPIWNSKEQFQDPTHHTACPPEMWHYWEPTDQWKLKESYGIKGNFSLLSYQEHGWYAIHKLIIQK